MSPQCGTSCDELVASHIDMGKVSGGIVPALSGGLTTAPVLAAGVIQLALWVGSVPETPSPKLAIPAVTQLDAGFRQLPDGADGVARTFAE